MTDHVTEYVFSDVVGGLLAGDGAHDRSRIKYAINKYMVSFGARSRALKRLRVISYITEESEFLLCAPLK